MRARAPATTAELRVLKVPFKVHDGKLRDEGAEVLGALLSRVYPAGHHCRGRLILPPGETTCISYFTWSIFGGDAFIAVTSTRDQ